MRTTPLIGDKVWFGPRRMGWGWAPVSWEGWVVMAIVIGLILGGIPFSRRHPIAYEIVVVFEVLVMIGVCALKGTPPGGPKAYDEYVRARDRRR